MKVKHPKVLLANMPWTTIEEPSLGLGILKTQLDKKQITCNIRYFNIFLLQYFTKTTYNIWQMFLPLMILYLRIYLNVKFQNKNSINYGKIEKH